MIEIIKPHEVNKLEKTKFNVYLLLNEDELLRDEATAAIFKNSQIKEIANRSKFSEFGAEKIDWEEVSPAASGLFSFEFEGQRLIHLHFEDAPDKIAIIALKDLLIAHLDKLNTENETTLIISINKWRKLYERQAWYQVLSDTRNALKAAVYHCRSPSAKYFKDWIRSRLTKQKFVFDSTVIAALANLFENNTSALQQILNQFHIRGITSITLDLIKESVNSSSIYVPYQILPYLHEANLSKALEILDNLEQNKVQAVHVLLTLRNDLNLIYSFHDPMNHNNADLETPLRTHFFQNSAIDTKFKDNHIYGDNVQNYKYCISRLRRRTVYELFILLMDIELAIKTGIAESGYELLRDYCIKFCHAEYKTFWNADDYF